MSNRKVITRAWMEQAVLDAEVTELTPLTRRDLESVRQLIRRPLRKAAASVVSKQTQP